MRILFNLSFRYKIPLWGSALIVATALIIATSMLFRAYDDLKRDLLRNASVQGQTMAKTLVTAITQDHVWRAYEILKAPLSIADKDNPEQVEALLVINRQQQIYVSTQPQTLPMLADLKDLSPEFMAVANGIGKLAEDTMVLEPEDSEHLFVATPIIDEQARLGTLIQIYSKKILLPRFLENAKQAALITCLVLAVLLPINWYWGQSTATPLVRLAERMEELGQRLPENLSPEIYDYQDELGRLFTAYNRTLQQLREKALIEREVIHSERLVAIGQLAAGIAHEVNNPLLGMLTSINTLRHHGDPDARTLKTLTLLERGLNQIKDTVGALLVDAKVNSRNFSTQDVDDVRTLIAPHANKKRITLDWTSDIDGALPLPSTLVRQVLLNLILNALQATEAEGRVEVMLSKADRHLGLEIINSGQTLSEAQKEHLFEPFVNAGESGRGRGLGLWVCYQIVRQLGGNISVESGLLEGHGRTSFKVFIPLETHA
ncbi:MAG: HAMP domain-containing sensor histidine kinase [Sterolibacterium sp.]